MARRGRIEYINIRTRVPKDIGEAILARATADYPGYRVVRDIIVASVTGSGSHVQSLPVVQEIAKIAKDTGYSSAEALILDLSKAFLRVWRYAHGQLQDEERTPDEDIREMFSTMIDNNTIQYEKGISIRKEL